MKEFNRFIQEIEQEINALKVSAAKSLANVSTFTGSITVSPTFYKNSDGDLDEIGIPTIHVVPSSSPVIAVATLAGSSLNGRGFLIQDLYPGNNETGFKVLMEASVDDGAGMNIGDRKSIPVDFDITATGPFTLNVTYENLL